MLAAKQKDFLYDAAEFLFESNAVENEYSFEALVGALKAWEFSLYCWDMRIENILGIHELLMERINAPIAGKLRTTGVRVGPYIAPPAGEVKSLLLDWVEKYGRAFSEEDIKLAHIAFEKIHPFEDGNGRTGRIIMNWQRKKAGLRLLVIHTGREQQEYYGWFR